MSSQWAQLSSEVWSMIFELTKVAHDEGNLTESDLFKLPSVCKMFAAIFIQQSQLSSYIKVSKELSTDQMISLSRRIDLHRRSIDRYTDKFSGHKEGILLVMLAHQVALVRVMLQGAELPMEYIARMRSITYCELSHIPGLDLAPLHALPSLTVLVLGQCEIFENTDAAAVNLTRLELHTCNATCFRDCVCITSLKSLKLESSYLSHFHTDGVAACHSLESLSVTWSDIRGQDDSENFTTSKEYRFFTPVSLSNLSNLTALNFGCYGNKNADMSMINLSCLTGLKSLQRLSAIFEGGAGLKLPECMTAMTTLSHLSLGVRAYRDRTRNRLLLAFDFDWSGLVSLRHLQLMGDFKFSKRFRFSSLALVSVLEWVRIEVYGWKNKVDRDLLVQLSQLAHKLGTNRPDVRFTLLPSS